MAEASGGGTPKLGSTGGWDSLLEQGEQEAPSRGNGTYQAHCEQVCGSPIHNMGNPHGGIMGTLAETRVLPLSPYQCGASGTEI